MKFLATFLPLLLVLCASTALQGQSLADHWQSRVSKTQAEQPHWMTPVATVTPRLEQELRFDILHQMTPTGGVTNLDGGKGLELIPSRRTELLINLPPSLLHENPKTVDGLGDVSFTMKYRFLAHNEQHGNGILTAFLAGSIPTGTYKNGSSSAIVTPTLAGGKGWGKFDVQSTLSGTFPVSNVNILGRTIISNTAFQVHALKQLWPEAEINSTFWEGGTNDSKKQTFATPGLIFGRFPIHKRLAFAVGVGFQIATTHYHQYNHAFIATLRLPF
ncbi:MAG TPA: hypothetical protein VGT08_07900 [Terracidiphilus sp.]|nr:hypothetical protein [Terracidiphilus sp.]